MALLYAIPAALVTVLIVKRIGASGNQVRWLAAVAAAGTYLWTPVALFVLIFLVYFVYGLFE